MGGPEMAPHTPPRSAVPGEAVARLDIASPRSAVPGEALARLDIARHVSSRSAGRGPTVACVEIALRAYDSQRSAVVRHGGGQRRVKSMLRRRVRSTRTAKRQFD